MVFFISRLTTGMIGLWTGLMFRQRTGALGSIMHCMNSCSSLVLLSAARRLTGTKD